MAGFSETCYESEEMLLVTSALARSKALEQKVEIRSSCGLQVAGEMRGQACRDEFWNTAVQRSKALAQLV